MGVCRAEPVNERAWRDFIEWTGSGKAAAMDFMSRNLTIRRDPRLLLDGARSILCMAFSYHTSGLRPSDLPHISSYAFFADYHDQLRKTIRQSGVNTLLGREGTDWRICIDSAPVMERYWAVRSGIGTIGMNGSVIVPGYGSEVFLAEIITTLEFDRYTAEASLRSACGGCGACQSACPTGALGSGGSIDCNRCISYLTIEHRGEWTSPEHIEAMSSEAGKRSLFGCDRCISSCPLNHDAIQKGNNEKGVGEPLGPILNISADDIIGSDPERLSLLLRHSSLKRARRDGLLRNALNTKIPVHKAE